MSLARTYAVAIADSSELPGVDAAALVKNLSAHLVRAGRTKLLPHILRELQTLAKRRATLSATLEIADEGSRVAATQAAASAGIPAPVVRINESLVTGWRARSRSKLIDHSGKRALIDLYLKIIKGRA